VVVEFAGSAGIGVAVRLIDFLERELVIRADGDWRGFRSAACAKEPETATWLREVITEGTVFFDIGACVGSYALIAAALGARAHAFEPVAVNFAHLQQNAWLNSLENLRAWPVALTSRTGPLEITLSSPLAGAASHRVKHGTSETVPLSSVNEGRQVPALSTLIQPALGFALDDFVTMFALPQPEHIKIDVDGHEVSVLEGARATLRGVRTVMLEADPETAPSATAILAAAGLEQSQSWPRSGRQRNCLFIRV
jgi:FkbM family methyltransferase